MNERIRELARLTGGYYTSQTDPTFEGFDFSPEQLEKFAKLIIQECASICQTVGDALWSEQIQSNLGTARTCEEVILKHFGVNK